MNHGILVILSGFSGSGKGTAMKRLLEKYRDDYALSISATTRKPREGEVDGREYFFKTVEEFEAMIAEGKLLEYANYVGNYYGTPLQYVEEQLNAGKNVILEIEAQGAFKVKKMRPSTTLIFMSPPSAGELASRLQGRGTETDEVIRKRMERAREEADIICNYDYFIINDNIETCVDNIHHIIESERQKVDNNEAFISKMKEELTAYLKGDQ